MLIDLSCPVENLGISVRSNSETGEPYLLLKLLNISEKTITSINFDVKAFDENGTVIATLPVELTELTAAPKEIFAENKAISLTDVPDAKNFLVEITHATFESEEPYEPSEENTVEYDDSEASIQDVLAIREFIPEAICFASEKEDHWRCPCGRPNFLDSENCVRCGRSKEEMLNDYSSKSTLNNIIKAREEEEAQRAIEAENARLAKKKKTIKALIITGIVIVALALATVAGFFIRSAIISNQANNAAKGGDYLKAYELYSKINNDKKYELSSYVSGNSPSNLLFGLGYVAEDQDNIYFITHGQYGESVNLIKENKTTKEKTILTDAAHSCLNVVGDYIYFINFDKYPCRMTKDGMSTEVLFETASSYMAVIGTDVYYLKTDYENPKGLTEEECMILASQGQIKSYIRLHKFDTLTKKDTLISEEEISTCSIYNDRIYYLSTSETESSWNMSNLRSMDLSGKDVKTVVDVPVTSFAIKDDALYYISYFDENKKGMTVSDMTFVTCSITKLDLATGGKHLISDAEELVMDVNIYGDYLVYTAYNRTEFLNYSSGQVEGASVPSATVYSYNLKTEAKNDVFTGNTYSINVCGEDIFCILSYDGMLRSNMDGSVFEPVYEDGTSVSPEEAEAETPDIAE